ncbi:MAG: T9SS type B sorting domain-containing protein [Saprospiraceae bacterium]
MRPALFAFIILGCLFCAANLPAQPTVVWDRTLGGEAYEEHNALLPVADGIFIGGSSLSNLAFGTPTDISWNFLIFKTDLNGSLLWQTMLGGDQDERLWAFVATSDGGYLAGGYSESGIGGDKTQASRGGKDAWLLKLDAQGNKLWDRTLGSAADEQLFSIQELPNGDLLLGCLSNSGAGGEKSEPSRGGVDFWIVRTDAQGNKLWDKTLGGAGDERLNDIEPAGDGNFFLVGGTNSVPNSGDLGPEFARGGIDFWLLKFDPNARQTIWQHRYGGTGEDFPYSLSVSPSGHLWLGGRSGSLPAPPTAFNNGKDADFYGGDSDYWLLELDAGGNKIRDLSFGGVGLDDLYFIQAHECGGLTLGGVTDSGVSGNKTTAARGGYDYWLVGLDALGNQVWQQTFGGTGHDALTKMAAFPDGSWIFGGQSESGTGFEKTANSFGLNDFWVLRTECGLAANILQIGSPTFCTNDSLTLDATVQNCPSCSYEWNTGQTTPMIKLPPGTMGHFSVKVCDAELCVARDTVFVSVGQIPNIELGPSDTLLLEGNTLTFGGGNATWRYLWSTGSTNSTITVTEAGDYAVTVTDPSGCAATDAIRVELKGPKNVYVPNVFSPNDDGFNDWVTVFAGRSVRQVQWFQIYDRWGGLAFRRNSFLPNQETLGWDGFWRGKLAPMDVYTWCALVEYLDGSEEFFKGDLTLVR